MNTHAIRGVGSATSENPVAEELCVKDSAGAEIAYGLFIGDTDRPASVRILGLNEALLEELDAKGASGHAFMARLAHDETMAFARMANEPADIAANSRSDRRMRILAGCLFNLGLALKLHDKLLTPEQKSVLAARKAVALAGAGAVRPFAAGPQAAAADTNGCTLSPDGWWVACCDAHDRCYGSGARPWETDEVGRNRCDDAFYYCMVDKAGWVLANIYYHAVRALGEGYFKKGNNTAPAGG